MFFSICLVLTLAAQWTMGNPIEIVQIDKESGPKIPAKIIYLTFDDGVRVTCFWTVYFFHN